MNLSINDILGAIKIMKKIAPTSVSKKYIDDNVFLSPEQYLLKIESYLGNRIIKPKIKDDHVGIEIEFIGPDDLYIDLMMTILNKGLDKNVVLGWDGSIEVNVESTHTGYEIKIIDTEKNIFKTLKKVMNILSWYDISVNESCGLHVHLDSRNKSQADMYDKLYNMKRILYRMVPFHRHDNGYCLEPYEQNYEIGCHDKGIEISKHDTIEVRLHHGTLSYDEIANWLKLLIKIVSIDLYKNNKVWSRVPKFLGPETAKYVKTQAKMARAM
jgi:hypothetical protein